MNLPQTIKTGLLSGLAAVEQLVVSPRVPSLDSATNFLLLQHASALGSAIHSTPLIPALRHAVPNCRIAVAASGFSMDILRNNPGIDHLIETPSPLGDLRGAVTALRSQEVFDGKPYVTLTSTGNERTRIVAQAVLSGAATRVGFTVVPRLYRAPLAYDDTQSQIANNLRIIEALGHTTPHFEPQIFFSKEDEAAALDVLAASGAPSDRGIAVFITQTSVTQHKSWRPERFQAAASFLAERYGLHVVFIGTAAESAAIDRLRAGLPFATTNVAGKTSLTVLAALMSKATVGLSLDTGPMHVGRAVRLPMCIIAPAWSPPVEWLPVGDSRFRIVKNADLPAALPGYIIDEVSVDDVKAALEELLVRT
ncbi:glycosyltransferase family 9 protein [Edaphobacter sp.]|uniref:glycosyltransferase family 9 protein n=1 Tax=Edaphobacter sp. TaxID=1934404 RepID=UPI002DBA8933|nr:glycosyltransferase family 9 protein [Edaphobacter sp.]HEU5340701.1 glycosyltransferase family 9 protein [Edaphobacter sp.]